MASLFLNPPPPSLSISISKKNPTSTTTFSRYPLLKNPNSSLFLSPKTKTNSRKLLKFSANANYNEEDEKKLKKFESYSKFIFLEREKVMDEIEKSLVNDVQSWGITEVMTKKELDEALALEKKNIDEFMAFSAQAGKLVANLFEKWTRVGESEGKIMESIENLDVLIGPLSAESEENEFMKFVLDLLKFEDVKQSTSSKVDPLKEEFNIWDLKEKLLEYAIDPTIEKLENLQRLYMNRKKSCWSKHLKEVLSDAVFIEGFTYQIFLFQQNHNSSERLNVGKMERCFEHDTFFITDVRKFRNRWTFTGFLKKPIEEVMPKLEEELSKATGKDVIVYFSKHGDDMTKQVCTVESKESRDFLIGFNNNFSHLSISPIVLCIASFGMTTLMSSFLLNPNTTFEDYLANAVPLFGGLFSILGISEIATRITAARYGVKLSPSYLIPSIWTGWLGVINNYESLLPNNKALFDIPVARTASAYLTSLVLVITAFMVDGSFNGGNNPMYISPGFFSYNVLLHYIQPVIGPYRDDFGNVLPYVIEGVGVPVSPLAFAGILGFAVTSINLLPLRRMEGGRITQALYGHFVADLLAGCLKFFLLAIGVLDGNLLCLVWVFLAEIRDSDETPVKDEITPLGDERYALGFILQVICVFTLFPNIAGRFSIFQFSMEKIFQFSVEIYNVISSSLSYNS